VGKPKVFIDGQAGTTGLQIYDRVKDRKDIQIIQIPEEKRKDNALKLDAVSKSDVVILCLPDEAAKETAALIRNEKIDVKVIDASTAHRTEEGWVYGFPELKPDYRKEISKSDRVAVPGCYATGFIGAVKPLIDMRIFPPDHPFTVNAVSGHSGGGKKMISVFSEKSMGGPEEIYHFLHYQLDLNHKHVKEMKAIAGLKHPPLFLPSVDYSRQGMLVDIPIHRQYLEEYKTSFGDIFECLKGYYRDEKFVNVSKWTDVELRRHPLLSHAYLDAVSCNGTNRLEIVVCGSNDTHVNLCSRLDNLGKGASGAAIQNMNLMVCLPEDTGLT
jgi:N-acetyl-gamma-glutamyl-phosphate reductase